MPSRIQSALLLAIACSVLLVAASLSAFLLALQSTTAQLPRLAVETRDALLRTATAEGEKTRALIASLIQPVGEQTLALIDTHATRIEEKAIAELQYGTDALDRRAGEALVLAGETAQLLDQRAASMQADVRPVLANSAALVKDAQESLDDSYWDGKALLESATVATTSAAQASEAVRDAAPKLSQSAVSVGHSVAGIAAAVKREADELTKPQTTRQKIAAWLGLIPRIVRVIW